LKFCGGYLRAWRLAVRLNGMAPEKIVPGRLIAVEGVDGSGKRTQVELLAKALRLRGYDVLQTGFPIYESTFGKLIGQFLDGQLGPLEKVDARFTALLYAGDRLEAKPMLEAALRRGEIVLVDRYIGSNLAHQGSRHAAEGRAEFLDWIRHVEYEIYGLPRELLVIYLRVPPAEAQKMVARKAARGYTTATQDLQEASLHHLETAATVYDTLAQNAPWTTIQSFDATAGCMRSPQGIAEELLRVVEAALTPGHEAGAR
jgi:dTMP kinase